jgi:methylated-DNA-[protein]-cysteine S-methyltransferase
LAVTKVVAVLERSKSYAAGVFTPEGVYATSLPRDTEKEAISSVGGEGLPRDDKPEFIQILDQVHSVFSGEPIQLKVTQFDFSDLTENQVRILQTVRSIPRGDTLTYGQVAEKSGIPNAARFVGTVMATNRFAPIIPCHRVVAANSLGGYSGGKKYGVSFKRRLLLKEGAKIAKK